MEGFFVRELSKFRKNDDQNYFNLNKKAKEKITLAFLSSH
jgi:hypothetical protein